jgi:hypothetical protein
MELSPDGAADPFPRRAPPKFLLPRLTATANDNEPDALLVVGREACSPPLRWGYAHPTLGEDRSFGSLGRTPRADPQDRAPWLR